MHTIGGAVQAVHSDRTSGSESVAQHVTAALADLALAQAAAPDFHARIRGAALDLCRARPPLPVVRNRVADLGRVLLDLRSPTARIVPVAIQTWRTELRRSMERLQAQATKELSGTQTVATISRSTTVDLVIRGLPGAQVRVLATSGGESATVVDNWRLQGRKADGFPDAHEVVAGADVVLVGADAVFPDGSIWNRTGTVSLFEAAHQAGVPCWVAASTAKLEPWSVPDQMNGQGHFSLAPAPDRFATEHGALDVADLGPHMDRIAEARRRVGDSP